MAKRTMDDVIKDADVSGRKARRKFRELTQVEPVAFKNVGDSVEGTFKRVREVRVDGRNQTIYDLIRDDGGRVSFWGSPFIDSRFDVSPGQYVRVTFKSEEDTGQPNPMRVFKIEVA